MILRVRKTKRVVNSMLAGDDAFQIRCWNCGTVALSVRL